MNPNNNTGYKLIGFGAIYDEAELLEGWVKTLRFFCDEVWALYDPRSSDGTIELLYEFVERYKDTNVPVYLYEQNIKLGDSDRYVKGDKGIITFLANANRFIREYIPLNTWTMWLAGDERLDLRDKEKFYSALSYAEDNHYNAVKFKLYDIYNDLEHYINYTAIMSLAHRKLIKRTRDYQYNLILHHGFKGAKPWLETDLRFYHFGNYYDQQRNWWRSENGANYIPRIPEHKRFVKFDSPFLDKDWKTEA